MALLQLAPPTTAPATAGGPQPQPGPAGPASTPAAAADATGTSPRGAVVWVSLAVIAVALVGCGVLNWRVNPVPFTVPAGVGVFAVFYAVTQGLERLLEPISALVYKTNDAVTNRNRTLAQALSTSPAGNRQTAIQKAAARSRSGGEGWRWQQADSAASATPRRHWKSSALVLRTPAGVADSPL
jgi:hypothetical protein